ncbi:L-threonylcarbamoyladenylate synthase [Psychromonas ingrahamii]|uniref:L-threonylcarbamoyladenylate synthase n=1 Tax=Psychromonas ingrahamii TaxID=357794 RepID=UPI0005A2C2CA|nr:L-threonylcarbamoyladenylate synthase [Psychromonas ingrahamii]
MLKQSELNDALKILKSQGVIAYPTESVFGLGCDPDCEAAIQKILLLKQRPAYKGLILIAASIEQLEKYADFSLLTAAQLTVIKKTWPGPITWIVPSQKNLSKLISGDFESVAVRVTAHPIVRQICLAFDKPIISTSANLSSLEAALSSQQVNKMFKSNTLLNLVIDAPVSGLSTPTQIFHASTGKRLR